ncbi:fasciclin domain-containing protein [Salinimicrobium gaetbulicola]|uniref:Fasciclin domain-containing protein n=1 Tax=Salinimicrobium gaetbulicola TaxID=999702 RepID=A0ABW3IGC0_9FLAO
MKTYVAKLHGVQTMIHLLLVGFLSLLLISCEEENVNSDQESDFLALKAEKPDKSNAAPAPGDYTITELALGDDRFSELVSALLYVDQELDAGLVDLFNSEDDDFTVFAPNNEAFGRLYETLGVDDITDLDPQLVANVLYYHVTNGRRAANSVVPPNSNNTKSIQTLLGEKFMVNSDGQIIAIGNTAGILDANISASNGIIHEISEVLLPITL